MTVVSTLWVKRAEMLDFTCQITEGTPPIPAVVGLLFLTAYAGIRRKRGRPTWSAAEIVTAYAFVYVTNVFLAPGTVDTFWINFPDPWPKKRHAKHRIVQPDFVHLLATRLRPGGTLHLATDDRAYAEQMDEVLSAEPLLENVLAPRHWTPEVPGRMHTGYEEEWRAEGRPLHFFEYRRTREPLEPVGPAAVGGETA